MWLNFKLRWKYGKNEENLYRFRPFGLGYIENFLYKGTRACSCMTVLCGTKTIFMGVGCYMEKVKRIIAAILTVVVVFTFLAVPAMAATQTFFSDDFEGADQFQNGSVYNSTYHVSEVKDLSASPLGSNATNAWKMKIGNAGLSGPLPDGPFNNRLAIDASSSSIVPNTVTSVTAYAEIYVNEPDATTMGYMDASMGDDRADGYTGMVVYLLGQKMRVRFKYADMTIYYGTENGETEYSAGSFGFDTWYKVAFVFHPATNTCDFYVNGARELTSVSTAAETGSSLPLIRFNTALIKYGANLPYSTANVKGMSAVFDNVLVTAEVPDPVEGDIPSTGDGANLPVMLIVSATGAGVLIVLAGALLLNRRKDSRE